LEEVSGASESFLGRLEVVSDVSASLASFALLSGCRFLWFLWFLGWHLSKWTSGDNKVDVG
jgi:hypothetical protein